MPCNSEYLVPTSKEKKLIQVACLLDELDGKPFNEHHWNGYHPAIYNKQVDADEWVSRLCKALQEVDVSKYSLEMQIWWRDHQKADKERVERELKEAKEKKDKAALLASLSDYEKKLLGLK